MTLYHSLLHSAMSHAGTFHLLHMLVDDYIVHTLETMLEKEQEESHLNRINILKHGMVQVGVTRTVLKPQMKCYTADFSSLPLELSWKFMVCLCHCCTC